MFFQTYVLKSVKNGHYYVGSCQDLNVRIDRHNKGLVKSTKSGRSWKLIYSEEHESRQKAFRREKQIKSYKGGEAFKKLIDDCGRLPEWLKGTVC